MRHRDWQSRLSALIAERMDSPFVWAKNDCCLFAADAIKAMTGEDPAENLRGKYSTERGAHRLVRTMGGLVSIAEKACGEEVKPSMARVGDVVLGTTEQGRDCLGICTGKTWHGPGLSGLYAQPMETAKRAWRV